jgi:hypothetical protein
MSITQKCIPRSFHRREVEPFPNGISIRLILFMEFSIEKKMSSSDSEEADYVVGQDALDQIFRKEQDKVSEVDVNNDIMNFLSEAGNFERISVW